MCIYQEEVGSVGNVGGYDVGCSQMSCPCIAKEPVQTQSTNLSSLSLASTVDSPNNHYAHSSENVFGAASMFVSTGMADESCGQVSTGMFVSSGNTDRLFGRQPSNGVSVPSGITDEHGGQQRRAIAHDCHNQRQNNSSRHIPPQHPLNRPLRLPLHYPLQPAAQPGLTHHYPVALCRTKSSPALLESSDLTPLPKVGEGAKEAEERRRDRMPPTGQTPPRSSASTASQSTAQSTASGTRTQQQQENRLRRRGAAKTMTSGRTPPFSSTASGRLGSTVAKEMRRMAMGCSILPNELDTPTVYHGVSVPLISIEDYLANLQDMCYVSGECLVLSLIYIKRLLAINPKLRLNMLTVHRMALSCVVIAAKFLEDIFFTNSCYAHGGGVRLTKELNFLEFETLKYLRFRVYVDCDMYELCLESLAKGKPLPTC